MNNIKLLFQNTAKIMGVFLGISLILLSLLLALRILQETYDLTTILLIQKGKNTEHVLMEHVVIWFLYFEFIALICKYFQSNLHFPLRYFIYISITAIIRLIIIDHSKPSDTLYYATSILMLVFALYLANTRLLKRS